MRDDTVPICCCTALWRNPASRSNRDRGWPLKQAPCRALPQRPSVPSGSSELPRHEKPPQGSCVICQDTLRGDGCCLIRAGYEGLLAGGLNLVWPCLACPACLVFFDRLGPGFAHADPSTCVRVGDRSWRKAERVQIPSRNNARRSTECVAFRFLAQSMPYC